MNAAFEPLAAHALALVLTGLAIAAAVGALMARSLVAMVLCLAAVGALTASALLALSAGDAALAQALFAFALAPVILLAALLLSSRAAKARRHPPWLAIGAAIAAGAAVLWATSDMTPVGGAMPAPDGALAPWLAPLVFVAVAAAFGLLAYGERGALEHSRGLDE